MATKARQQYFADENSLQKDSREFSIADSIQQKIDSIETGAEVNAIETVKVNGTALTPDANRAVDISVPDVIDNLYTSDGDNALSAKQGKLLYEYIQNIGSRGRYLSNWNCATGLPVTNPSENPYPYKAGDYYTVSNVAVSPAVNYRPDGNQYVWNQASNVQENDNVVVSDFYLYDGTNWLLLSNRQIAVDSSLSTTSPNPVENRVVTNALNTKQNTLTAGSHISISSNVISAEGFQEPLTAGENITIGDACTTESDMKGPCPKGFHVPLESEFLGIINAGITLGAWSSTGVNDISTYLKLPAAGLRHANNSTIQSVGHLYYRLSTFKEPFDPQAFNDTSSRQMNSAFGEPIRPFKNIPITPDNTWTTLYNGSSVATGAGIFHNATEGLISISSDGIDWATITDKNLGATNVYNYGDTMSEANCGYYYQWGNNYGFPGIGSSETVVTTSTQVDASSYGPGNYYYSSDFYADARNPRWRISKNTNLRGGVSQGTFQDCVHNVISATDTTYTAGSGINIDQNNEISNTGVTSVNSQTGDVTVSEFTPGGTATTGYVVTKTADGYEWSAPSGGDVVVSSDTDNVLTTGADLRAGDENDLPATPDSNTLYFCY